MMPATKMFGVVKGTPFGYTWFCGGVGEFGRKMGVGAKNVVAERCDFGAKL